MYRSLYLLAVIYTASALRNCPFQHHHENDKFGHTKAYHNTLFEEVSNDVIAADKKIQDFCAQNSNSATKEFIDIDGYRIITPLPDFEENDVEVKIRHTVLYINANKPPKRYSEIRLLPSFVNPKTAGFKLENGTLTIKLEIKAATDADRCTNNVDSDLVTVPKLVEEFEFNERMGSDF